MISDFGLFVAAVYFSSLIFILIPSIGVIIGAIAGRLTPGAGIALGALIGLATSVVGLVLAFLISWALLGFGYEDLPKYLSLLLAFGLTLGGAFAPIAVVPLVRAWRSTW